MSKIKVKTHSAQKAQPQHLWRNKFQITEMRSRPAQGANNSSYTISNLIISGVRERDEVTEILQQFWDTESISIKDSLPENSTEFDSKFSNISYNG